MQRHPEVNEIRQSLGRALLSRFDGDIAALADAMLGLHRHNSTLVGLREGGREILVWEQFPKGLRDSAVVSYALVRGEPQLQSVVYRCDLLELDAWVREQKAGWDWVYPRWS